MPLHSYYQNKLPSLQLGDEYKGTDCPYTEGQTIYYACTHNHHNWKRQHFHQVNTHGQCYQTEVYHNYHQFRNMFQDPHVPACQQDRHQVMLIALKMNTLNGSDITFGYSKYSAHLVWQTLDLRYVSHYRLSYADDLHILCSNHAVHQLQLFHCAYVVP